MNHDNCTKENNTIVWDKNKIDHGHFTRGGYSCKLQDCSGTRFGVRWQDGTITFPCSEGMNTDILGEWTIL